MEEKSNFTGLVVDNTGWCLFRSGEVVAIGFFCEDSGSILTLIDMVKSGIVKITSFHKWITCDYMFLHLEKV